MFANTYCCVEFRGLQGRQYPERHDRFQQLIGCYFQELYRLDAHVAPTTARDGSIDIFVEPPSALGENWEGVPFPFIVECKDHDDESANLTRNIEQGWRKVETKLREQAAKGWIGHFEPWKRTRAYVYCVSPDLNQAQRDTLQSSIQEFFNSLPTDKRPPITAVKVLCWSDVRELLNRHPRLADAWLGVCFSFVSGHEEYRDGLRHFRSYLKEENLSFVPPDPGCPSHPCTLLRTLGQGVDKPGVLLVGPGGVGKTRTCLETAHLAHQEGWRVLHLRPTDARIDMEDLGNTLIQGTTRTLLVIDYIDQLGLSFERLRRDILELARQRGLYLALLANARPGVMFEYDCDRDAIFDVIRLEIHDRQEAIVVNVTRSIAPGACKLLGEPTVREICGTRPIIAMFVARELERMAQTGALNEDILNRLRHADLSEWLVSRLRKDGLIPEGSPGVRTPPDPEHEVLAAAACLAATPLSAERLNRVMLATLTSLAVPDPEGTAEGLLESLMTLGWLETVSDSPDLQSPHDVVTDELLENALLDKGRGGMRRGCIEPVLAAAIAMPRALGRFVVALDRLLGQWSKKDPKSEKLTEAAGNWFAAHWEALARTFSLAEPDETAYALGAAITSHAWGKALRAHWGALVLPWLKTSISYSASRHLLYRSLKILTGPEAGDAIALAMDWLGYHGVTPQASFVLAPLLSRDDLGEKVAQEAITAAMAWLNEHPKALEAQFVFNPLLGRDDLGEKVAQEAITAAMAWLNEHPKALEAQFVFNPLLGRDDLGEKAQRVNSAALTWLEDHFLSQEAEFVVRHLLGNSRLTAAAKEKCARLALKRAEIVLNSPEASFILRSCLSERRLSTDLQEELLRLSLQWLKSFSDEARADYVFTRILRRCNLPDDHWTEISTHALTWLSIQPITPTLDHTLNSLCTRPRLLDEQAIKLINEKGDQWLAQYPDNIERERLRRNLDRMLINPDSSGGTSCSTALSQCLKEGRMPDKGLLEQGLAQTNKILKQHRPASAGYYLSSLLPLSCRFNDQEYIKQAMLASKVFLDALASEPRIIHGFLNSMENSLEQGLWPNQKQGLTLLDILSRK